MGFKRGLVVILESGNNKIAAIKSEFDFLSHPAVCHLGYISSYEGLSVQVFRFMPSHIGKQNVCEHTRSDQIKLNGFDQPAFSE